MNPDGLMARQEGDTSMKNLHATTLWALIIIAGLGGGLVGGPAVAAEATFEQVLPARQATALLEIGNRVLVGLDGGGVLIHDRGNPAAVERLTAGQQLSGNNVTDIAWTGSYVWIATLGGGMTRVVNLDTSPEFRQYTSNLGDLNVTAVTGTVLAGTERVFYGMAGKGLGQITNGLSGNLYTAEQDGLIANDINALQYFGTELFVATPVGVSRFVNNEFTDQNAGLDDLFINDLTLDGQGNLIAGGNSGVFRWDPGSEAWTKIGSFGAWVVALSSSGDRLYALDLDSGGTGRLHVNTADVWTDVPLPQLRCSSVFAGQDLWVGGRAVETRNDRFISNVYLARQEAGGTFTTWEQSQTQVGNSEGVTFGDQGQVWMGAWGGQALSSRDGDAWLHIFELPSAANDTMVLFPFQGNVLSMASGPDGEIWAGQYASGGIIKYDPATNTTDLIDPSNSALGGRGIVNMITHPDGPLVVMHDWADADKVEVLVDPDNWQSSASWVIPPTDVVFGGGLIVWDAVVERRDVIWFAVAEVGLVRWDTNGDGAGPNDPLTWDDPSDDRWDDPVDSFPRTNLDPGKCVGLARGRDGSLWAAGNGLVQFTYEVGAGLVLETLTIVNEKTSSVSDGLVNGDVADVAVDANGDVWAATVSGLNRIRVSGDEVTVTAWIDLVNYLGNPNFGVLYSPNVIAPLPGLTYRKIVADGEGRRLLLSADQGTTLITVGSGGGQSVAGGDPLAGVYAYPNPWTPDSGASGLKLGGVPAAAAADGGVTVAIYNLDGQPVLELNNSPVPADTPFWFGDNFGGSPVATGLYLLKVSWGQYTAVKTLAVVR
jgi:hypothetical protein